MATKLADVTVASDGTWSSGPHTLTAGAKTYTLRRKSDGAVLATRSFTVEAASSLTYNADAGTTGVTLGAFSRSTTNVVDGTYSFRATGNGQGVPMIGFAIASARTGITGVSFQYRVTCGGTGGAEFLLSNGAGTNYGTVYSGAITFDGGTHTASVSSECTLAGAGGVYITVSVTDYDEGEGGWNVPWEVVIDNVVFSGVSS